MKRYRYRVFEGEAGDLFGVMADDHVLYEPFLPKLAAERLAELESRLRPPKDWSEAEQILIREGLLVK